jgi:DDE superfamily endonuclease
MKYNEPSIVFELKPFCRGAKVTVIGAVSLNKVLALMTMNDSINRKAFFVFFEKYLGLHLWAEAVVVVDNFLAHKRASIIGTIDADGAKFICLSPDSSDFHQINFWGGNSNLFCECFRKKNGND